MIKFICPAGAVFRHDHYLLLVENLLFGFNTLFADGDILIVCCILGTSFHLRCLSFR